MFHKKRKQRYKTNWLESVRKKSNLKVLYKRIGKSIKKTEKTKVEKITI